MLLRFISSWRQNNTCLYKTINAWFGMNKNMYKAYLNVTTTAVNILFVFYLELNNKSLVFVRERFFELSRNAVELRILTGLNTCWNEILFAKLLARHETLFHAIFAKINLTALQLNNSKLIILNRILFFYYNAMTKWKENKILPLSKSASP